MTDSTDEVSYSFNNIGKDVISEGVFERFPKLVPYIDSTHYDTRKHKRLLVISESNYINSNNDIFRVPDDWYKSTTIHDILIPDEWKNDGKITYLNGLFNSIKKLLNTKEYHDVAFYNYFFRPALGGENKFFKEVYDELDGKVAFSAFCGILETIRPDVVIFASAFAWEKMQIFKKINNKKFDGIYIGQVSHPSCPWWNKNDGYYGWRKFEDLLWEHWIRPINPIIKEQTLQVFNDFQTNPFWNREIWGDINWYDEKDGTCAYFDNFSKNISIDIYCAENDKYQFQIFERDNFKTIKPSGMDWIKNIPNLTSYGSRHESRLHCRQDITEILEKLMK
jgi:hypothetical protein